MNNVGLYNWVRDLVISFRQILDAHESHLKSFCSHGVQVEGWLKGEFLGFLEQQEAEGMIMSFNREEKVNRDERKKVDFRIRLTTETGTEYVWLELKHWLIGKQRGVKYDASFYFGDPTAVGIIEDAKKLTKVPDEGKYILILATANPGDDNWQKGVVKFNQKFTPISIESLVQPKDFPDHYSIGLLKVKDLAGEIVRETT